MGLKARDPKSENQKKENAGTIPEKKMGKRGQETDTKKSTDEP